MYRQIIQHYEECLSNYLGTSKEVDWPNESDAIIRYKKSLGVIEDISASIIDYGCGTGELIKHLPKSCNYLGIDASAKMLEEARKRWTEYRFIEYDILMNSTNILADYVICNGIFTLKCNLQHDDMYVYVKTCLSKLFKCCTKGMSVNFMDPAKCEWQRQDLFFMDYNLIGVLAKDIGCKTYQIHSDYGLRESFTYFYRD